MALQSKQKKQKDDGYDPFVKFLQGRDVAVCIFTAEGKSTILKGRLHQATKTSPSIEGHLVLEDGQKKRTIIPRDKVLYAKEM